MISVSHEDCHGTPFYVSTNQITRDEKVRMSHTSTSGLSEKIRISYASISELSKKMRMSHVFTSGLSGKMRVFHTFISRHIYINTHDISILRISCLITVCYLII